jgi:hypothetical protein
LCVVATALAPGPAKPAPARSLRGASTTAAGTKPAGPLLQAVISQPGDVFDVATDGNVTVPLDGSGSRGAIAKYEWKVAARGEDETLVSGAAAMG